MTLSKTLLAGVSVFALTAAVPALARSGAPSIHLATTWGTSKQGVQTHVKTGTGNPQAQSFTETATFTAALSKSADYKQKIELLGETWYSSQSCAQPTKQSWKKLPKKTKYATVSTSTSTGTISNCPGTTFTFQDINYELTSKTAKKDEVTGDLVAKNFNGYNLTLIANVDITIGK